MHLADKSTVIRWPSKKLIVLNYVNFFKTRWSHFFEIKRNTKPDILLKISTEIHEP